MKAIILIIALILSLVANVYFVMQNNKNTSNKPNITKSLNITLTPTLNSTTPSLVPQKTETVLKLTPQYSVIVSAPVTIKGGFNFAVTLKNISVTPYITNLAFYECNFLDNQNNVYKGTVVTGAESHLKKALLPGENLQIKFNGVSADLNNGASVNIEGPHLDVCSRNEEGVNICKKMDSIKIKDCLTYITTNDGQAGSGWGKYPVKISFP